MHPSDTGSDTYTHTHVGLSARGQQNDLLRRDGNVLKDMVVTPAIF